MEARFDIYLSGKLADGITPAAAAAAMAQLFRSTPEAMAAMLDGKPRLLKRDVDHPTALKYRDALQRAGVLVSFRPFTRTASERPAQPAAPASPGKPAPPAAAVSAPVAAAASTAVSATAATVATPSLTLAPAEGELLRPDERPTVAAVAVDTSHLQVEAPGELPRLPATPPAPPPDTSHLSLAEAGADLAPARPQAAPVALSPEMAAMTLAEPGALLETLHSELPPLAPDTSALSLAEPGELLRPDERRRAAPPPPPTDHLHLV